VSKLKVGDKVWFLCEVIEPCDNLIKVTGSGRDNWFWASCKQCRPVEPSNSPEIPDSSSDPIRVGDAVRFVLPGHDRHETEGVILSIVKGPNREYQFRSNCGQFHRYCTALELERIIKRYRTPKLADLANGPIACESRDNEWQDWKSRVLTEILDGPGYPFLCLSAGANNSLRYAECRIEVGE